MRRKIVFFTAFFMLFSPFLSAAPALEPSVQIAFLADDSAELSPLEIIKTALEFSLCPAGSERGKFCVESYCAAENFAVSNFSSLPEMERGEKILLYMHDSILKRYEANESSMAAAFETGKYNCVTASILYYALAKACNLAVFAQETPQHAFCIVEIDGQRLSVETTNMYGFNPGTKKTVAETENEKRFAYVPKKYYSNKKEVSSKAFATLPGKNAVSAFNDKNDFDSALPLAVSILIFLKNDGEEKTAKDNLDLLASNYSAVQSRRKNAAETLSFLENVGLTFGWSGVLRTAFHNTLYNSVADFLNAGSEEDAQRIFDAWKHLLAESQSQKIQKMITDQVFQKKEIEIHNQAVPLFNSRRYEEAKKIIEEGLKAVPGSRTLQRDLNAVNKILLQN